MENEIKISNEGQKESKKNYKWFSGYIVAGIIWYLARSFNKTVYDGIIILIIAILCGYFYHRLKNKIKIKNEISKIIVTFLILEIIAGFVIGVLTSLF